MNFTKGVTLANTVLTKLGARAHGRQGVRVHEHKDPPRSSTCPARSPACLHRRCPTEAHRRLPLVGDTDDERAAGLRGLCRPDVRGPSRSPDGWGLSRGRREGRALGGGGRPARHRLLHDLPRAAPEPTTSSMNFTTGVTLANTVITKLEPSGKGKVCLYAARPHSSSTSPARAGLSRRSAVSGAWARCAWRAA